ncbi:hypothetical protein O988_09479, partial [Pseudogymnoascus sp. VKM F-3808]
PKSATATSKDCLWPEAGWARRRSTKHTRNSTTTSTTGTDLLIDETCCAQFPAKCRKTLWSPRSQAMSSLALLSNLISPPTAPTPSPRSPSP